MRKIPPASRGTQGVVQSESEQPGAVGGRLRVIKEVRHLLFPMERCEWLIWIILWPGTETWCLGMLCPRCPGGCELSPPWGFGGIPQRASFHRLWPPVSSSERRLFRSFARPSAHFQGCCWHGWVKTYLFFPRLFFFLGAFIRLNNLLSCLLSSMGFVLLFSSCSEGCDMQP